MNGLVCGQNKSLDSPYQKYEGNTIRYVKPDKRMLVTIIAINGRRALWRKSLMLTLRPNPTMAAVKSHVVTE